MKSLTFSDWVAGPVAMVVQKYVHRKKENDKGARSK